MDSECGADEMKVLVCLVRAQVRAWRRTGVWLALGCVVLWGWEHPVEAQTFMQSSKVEVMGGVGGIPEVASGLLVFHAHAERRRDHLGNGTLGRKRLVHQRDGGGGIRCQQVVQGSDLDLSAFAPLPAPNFWKPDVRIHRRQPVALSDTEAVDRAHRGE